MELYEPDGSFYSGEEAKSSDCKPSENIEKKTTTTLAVKNEPPPAKEGFDCQMVSPQQSQSTKADSVDGKMALLEGLSKQL